MSPRHAIHLAAAAMLLAILGGAAVGTWNIRRVYSSGARVARASELEARLADLQGHLVDAETGQRGFLLTGEEEYLQPYYTASGEIAPMLDRIQALTDPDTTARRTLPDLRRLVATKLRELERTVAVRRDRGDAAARAIVMTGVGRTTMDEIRADLDVLRAEQQRIVENEAAASAVSERVAIVAELVAAVGGVLLVAFGVQRSHRLLAAREESDRVTRELLDATQDAARARAELLDRERELNRLKDDFLATVSHELRTPMNAVLGWVKMLRAGAVRDDRVQDALQAVERNAVMQHRLIEDLLDLSRVVAGKLRLEFADVDLGSVADEAYTAIFPSAREKGVHVEKTCDADLPRLHADPQRMQQVIWNLLANAVKFTPAGGHVRLEVRRSGRDAIVEVRDDGEGIAPESLPHVWERFRQESPAPGHSTAGLGLGLAIVRHIVELHGGTVMAESAGRGSGATFRIVLPAGAATPAPRQPQQAT